MNEGLYVYSCIVIIFEVGITLAASIVEFYIVIELCKYTTYTEAIFQ
jgi:hypothetical protein